MMMMMRAALMLLGFLPLMATVFIGYQLLRNGQGIVGRPPVTAGWFYFTKLCAGLIFVLLMAACLNAGFFLSLPVLLQKEIPEVQQLAAGIFLLAGNLLLLPALLEMGIFTRSGLPTTPHVLCTQGVYRLSRNPMYTSFLFFYPACFLLVPSIPLLLLMAVNLLTHHRIIIREEQFLSDAFPVQYLSYKKEVARYL
ncbi:MAG: isoprenylcysteine carboxylmethyltransferase family protein [Mangrovibacterium sp.]